MRDVGIDGTDTEVIEGAHGGQSPPRQRFAIQASAKDHPTTPDPEEMCHERPARHRKRP